jgi:hypothetical protein
LKLALGLQFYLLSEVQIFWIHPDIYIVATASGIPKGIVEVRKAGEIAMTNEFIAGEVFDHMMHLRSLFGVRQVFAILTSYDEWRVCWLPEDESNKLAAADSLAEVPVFETPTKAKTGPSEIARPKMTAQLWPHRQSISLPMTVAFSMMKMTSPRRVIKK